MRKPRGTVTHTARSVYPPAMRVGVVGMGWVGASVASSLLHGGVRELWLADAKPGLAEGEAMDLAHAASLLRRVKVEARAIADMRGADAVVVAAGHGGGPDETRLSLLSRNAEIVRSIASDLRGFTGLLVMVTNPVDVLTRVMVDASGLPPERVLGTGTLLDTARLRERLGRRLELDPRSIHAQVIGEHGDSEVALFSSAQVGGMPLRRWPGWDAAEEPAIAEEVRRAAYEIIARKGATNHAIGVVTARLLGWALRDERRVLTVSRVHGGLGGVATSLPAVVGRGGATEVLTPDMDASERAAFERSNAVLQAAWQAL